MRALVGIEPGRGEEAIPQAHGGRARVRRRASREQEAATPERAKERGDVAVRFGPKERARFVRELGAEVREQVGLREEPVDGVAFDAGHRVEEPTEAQRTAAEDDTR